MDKDVAPQETIPCFNCPGTMYKKLPLTQHEIDACKCFNSNELYVCDRCGVICYKYTPKEKE